MGPLLVTTHGAAVHSAFVGLGVIGAGVVFAAQALRAGPYDERLLVVVAGTLVGGAVGAGGAGGAGGCREAAQRPVGLIGSDAPRSAGGQLLV